MAQQYLVDAEGNEIPKKHIDKMKVQEHNFVLSAIKRAQKLSERIEKEKQYILERADTMIAKIWQNNDLTKTVENGYSLQSFDRGMKVEVKVSKTIDFDEHIEMAQEILNQFIESKTQDADAAVKALINSAFTTSKGRLDTNRVLSLLALNIKDTDWNRAMTLIRKSIGRNMSKRYCNIWIREGVDREWQRINLNWTSA